METQQVTTWVSSTMADSGKVHHLPAKGAYTCNITGTKRMRYATGKLDFFAVYLVPIDLWYIIPFELAARKSSLSLTPYNGEKFGQYMEAWHLLPGR